MSTESGSLQERSVVIRSARDVSPALGLSLRHDGAIVTEENLCAEFFDLRTGFAGDLMQRFVNYRARLAIVVADPRAHGERFGELVYEHETHPHVRFFTTEADARGWLNNGDGH